MSTDIQELLNERFTDIDSLVNELPTLTVDELKQLASICQVMIDKQSEQGKQGKQGKQDNDNQDTTSSMSSAT